MKSGMQFSFTAKDKEQMREHGVRQGTIEKQLHNFIEGFPYARVVEAATPEYGILQLSENQIKEAVAVYDAWNGEVEKFVPASGAATRMFKALYTFLDDGIKTNEVEKFIEQIEHFAFFPLLRQRYKGDVLLDIKQEPAKVIDFLLSEHGLGYGKLPKGLLDFHMYTDTARTPFEEHIVEGIQYAQKEGKVTLHFTISPEHEMAFNKLWEQVHLLYEQKYNVRIAYTYSFQHNGTDTLAVTADNEPFRGDVGQLVFRPGGHGALLENLNMRDTDLLFVKNIDNVVPDALKETTITYKKALAGILLKAQKQIFKYQQLLDESKLEEVEPDIVAFLQDRFPGCLSPDYSKMPAELRRRILFGTLFRPIRVCGMVKNEGEPGGGPFWVAQPDGSKGLQIVEMAQLDQNDTQTKQILAGATHFNPVDLVCGVRNYLGDKYDLPSFRDDNTGFISIKSHNGQKLKAQELPGLWNGAMAFWNTLFVEVPIETFNPVKTVMDLLRPNHQSK